MGFLASRENPSYNGRSVASHPFEAILINMIGWSRKVVKFYAHPTTVN
jgi:hypothetical protein